MSLTAIIFAAVYFSGMLLTFYNPVYGVITYIFEWHNHPPYFWWGDELPDLRWSYSIAIATLASFALNRSRLKEWWIKPDYRPLIWMILIALNMALVSSSFAYFPELSFEKTTDVIKKAVLFALLVSLVRTHKDYKVLIWVVMVCVAYMGFISLSGSNRDIGVIAPNATEENALSAHIMAMLPFFGVYFLISEKRWQKLLILIGIPLCLNLIILANSRATIVGLMAIGVLSIFLVKGKYRLGVMAGLLIGAFTFLQLTNDAFMERQTTDSYQDNSASSRLWIWTGAWEMWKDHPMGVGDQGFEELSTAYIPEIDSPKSQHNTYVAVFTDWGLLGIVFYMALMIHCFVITFQVKRWAKWRPELQDYFLESTAIQLAMVGIAIAGMFHSRQYSEVVYWLYAFAVIQKNLIREEMAELDELETGEAEEAKVLEPAEVSGNGIPAVQKQGLL